MHKIGDKIIYGASGVMTIVDIREESVGDVSRSYYVLIPTNGRSTSLTFVPLDNEKLLSSMYPLLTKDEILELIRKSREVEPIAWVNENRARGEFFKRVMESGDRLQMFAMIRAIDESEKRREAIGKKNFLTDETARHKALRLLYSEFATVLDIPEEDVGAFIESIV